VKVKEVVYLAENKPNLLSHKDVKELKEAGHPMA